MPLRFLEFDYSETPDGAGTFDALASVGENHWQAVQHEAAAVLAWAHAAWGPPQPLDEGGVWDVQVNAAQECLTPLQVDYCAAEEALTLVPADGAPPRYTLALTLSGSAEFCAEVRARFVLE